MRFLLGWCLVRNDNIGIALTILQQHRNRRIHRHGFGAFGNQDFSDLPLIDGFDFHRCLIGFNFGDHVTRSDLIPFFHKPLGEIPLGHGGR